MRKLPAPRFGRALAGAAALTVLAAGAAAAAAPRGAGPVAAAPSTSVAAAAANRILYSGAALKDHQAALAAFAVLSIAVGVAPLIAFTPALVRLRQAGVLTYGRLATDYVQSFERKWLDPKAPRDELLLGSPDIQSLSDMGGSFDRAIRTSPTLIDRRVIMMRLLGGRPPRPRTRGAGRE